MFASNVCVKCWRISEIYAANVGVQSMRNYEITAPHNIYDRNKADVEISAPIKIYAPNVCVHQKIGAQTLTIWARQNLQLLTSSKSGWRALVQVMLSLLHAVLKWEMDCLHAAFICALSPVLYRLLYWHDLSKYLRPVQISAGAYILGIFADL